MKKPIQAKFVGETSDLKELLKLLSRDVEVVTSSTFLPNESGLGFHIYVTLIPKLSAEAPKV